jgi:uncharacterized membrane protein (UPF0127 family)
LSRSILFTTLVIVGAAVLLIAATLALRVDDSDFSSADDDGSLESLTIETADGEAVRLTIEVADTAEERTHGLSNRTELAEDAGLLFVIPTRGPGFWMKDTFIPLSVAFIGRCGEIVDIQDMQPHSLDIHQAEQEYAFGLEVNQGWFSQSGVATGDVVSIPSEYHHEEC